MARITSAIARSSADITATSFTIFAIRYHPLSYGVTAADAFPAAILSHHHIHFGLCSGQTHQTADMILSR